MLQVAGTRVTVAAVSERPHTVRVCSGHTLKALRAGVDGPMDITEGAQLCESGVCVMCSVCVCV